MAARIFNKTPPHSILILGSGVFGLSTAYALAQRPAYENTSITVIDRSPFPAPDGSSIDSSRIIRADYSVSAYASLAAYAQESWRTGFGGEGAYSESGFVLTCDVGKEGYIRASLENVTALSRQRGDDDAIQELTTREQIIAATKTGGGSGYTGYINRRSGWADAESAMIWFRRKAEAISRIRFLTQEVVELLKEGHKVTGVRSSNGETIQADLTILATGAWTPRFVDLRGRAQSTGQALCYLSLSDAEQKGLADMPVMMNMSTGLFIMPPRNNILKVARHGYGYTNAVTIPSTFSSSSASSSAHPTSSTTAISLPRTTHDDPTLAVPLEGQLACRRALQEMIPSLGHRPFSRTRICWYTDTPDGDFIIDYHPEMEGLFLATGGSGHAYKFLPVIGDKVVDCIEGRCPSEFEDRWAWPRETVEDVLTEDGTRGGKPGLVLDEELRKTQSRL